MEVVLRDNLRAALGLRVLCCRYANLNRVCCFLLSFRTRFRGILALSKRFPTNNGPANNYQSSAKEDHAGPRPSTLSERQLTTPLDSETNMFGKHFLGNRGDRVEQAKQASNRQQRRQARPVKLPTSLGSIYACTCHNPPCHKEASPTGREEKGSCCCLYPQILCNSTGASGVTHVCVGE